MTDLSPRMLKVLAAAATRDDAGVGQYDDVAGRAAGATTLQALASRGLMTLQVREVRRDKAFHFGRICWRVTEAYLFGRLTADGRRAVQERAA